MFWWTLQQKPGIMRDTGDRAMSDADAARSQIIEAARALLDGEISAIVAAQRIANLRHDVDPEQTDEDLLTFAGIDSETDGLTVMDSLRGWAESVRADKERELARAEAFHRPDAVRSAEALLAKYRVPHNPA